jgi:hypothetical protein
MHGCLSQPGRRYRLFFTIHRVIQLAAGRPYAIHACSLGNAGSEHIGFCIDSRGFDHLRLQRPIMTQLELPGLALCWPRWVSSISARNVQKCIEDDILRYRDFG